MAESARSERPERDPDLREQEAARRQRWQSWALIAVGVTAALAVVLLAWPSPSSPLAVVGKTPARPRTPGQARDGKAVASAEGPDTPPARAAEAPPPDGLTRGELTSVLAPLRAQIPGCFKGRPGEGAVKIVIGGGGKVGAATVTGPLAGTVEAECVEALVRGAVFHSSRREATTVMWSFMLGPRAAATGAAAVPGVPVEDIQLSPGGDIDPPTKGEALEP